MNKQHPPLVFFWIATTLGCRGRRNRGSGFLQPLKNKICAKKFLKKKYYPINVRRAIMYGMEIFSSKPQARLSYDGAAQ